MEKLKGHSYLVEIISRINEIVEEINNNKEVYETLKPNIKEKINYSIKNTDIPKEIPILVMGMYKIEMLADIGTVNIDLFSNGKTTNISLNPQRKTLDDVFLLKGDKIIIRQSNINSESSIKINLEKNIVESFMDQYKLSKSNIATMQGISDESKEILETIKKQIEEFNYKLNIESASSEDLKSLLNILG
ncbi:hypothetical protein KQI68_06545 [Peptoniphilus sp. MSJ-1]|uniref:Uncharacterized protein n=1 Tax=Peptoniphilus ovalis TaxID=2841503 RepID=A0ABS6FJR5_9FIRM|nr:hypothetical protein [Peptoniphilus ovalis]MBU5669496.1 hypothetical protein [Peptoniphilus ovalis]